MQVEGRLADLITQGPQDRVVFHRLALFVPFVANSGKRPAAEFCKRLFQPPEAFQVVIPCPWDLKSARHDSEDAGHCGRCPVPQVQEDCDGSICWITCLPLSAGRMR